MMGRATTQSPGERYPRAPHARDDAVALAPIPSDRPETTDDMAPVATRTSRKLAPTLRCGSRRRTARAAREVGCVQSRRAPHRRLCEQRTRRRRWPSTRRPLSVAPSSSAFARASGRLGRRQRPTRRVPRRRPGGRSRWRRRGRPWVPLPHAPAGRARPASPEPTPSSMMVANEAPRALAIAVDTSSATAVLSVATDTRASGGWAGAICRPRAMPMSTPAVSIISTSAPVPSAPA